MCLFVFACISSPSLAKDRTLPSKQETFATAELAIEALVAGVRSGAKDDILKVLGPDGQRIASSGDPIADQAARERFLAAYDENHETKQETDTRAVLIIGKDEFPFPIPLVKEAAWRFDVDAGEEEILNRRIGNNELRAIAALRAYVEAQREYASEDRDGSGVQYARKLVSSEGKMDGLYWPAGEDQQESPLGPLVADAHAAGYSGRSEAPAPFHGYVFNILTGQGKDAPGGAMNYVAGGRMIGGFGLVAVPAEYGNSGVMTFIVNHDGDVFQKDLGPKTSHSASDIKVFNPDSAWTKVSGP